jgi:hypothetical protein
MSYDPAWPNTAQMPATFTTVLHISRDTVTSEEGCEDEESKLLGEAWDALEKLGFTVSERSTSIDFK